MTQGGKGGEGGGGGRRARGLGRERKSCGEKEKGERGDDGLDGGGEGEGEGIG